MECGHALHKILYTHNMLYGARVASGGGSENINNLFCKNKATNGSGINEMHF